MPKKIPLAIENGKKIWARNAEGKPICGAVWRGKVCHQAIGLALNGRCRNHGGKATGRPIVHGRRSMYRGVLGISGRVEELLKDPNLAAHRKSIAEMDALAESLLEGYEPTLPMWQGMEARWQECLDLSGQAQAGDIGAARQLFKSLQEGLEDSRQSRLHVSQVQNFVSLRDESRKHRVAENRREGQLEANINAKQANALGAILIQFLISRKGRLLDDVCLREIGNDIAREFGPTDRERVSLN